MPNCSRSYFLVLYFFALAKCVYNFSYNDDDVNGPKNWPNLSSECAGKRQSPIDLKEFTDVAEENSLTFDNYGKDITTAVIQNSGHKIRLYINQDQQDTRIMMFRGSLLITEYQLNWITFHWGRQPGQGSEHHLNGNAFDLEMHLVHQRKNNNAAPKDPNEYAVIAIFFKVAGQTNDELKKITEKLAGVTKNGDKQSLPSLNVRKLMPLKGNLMRYNGSNTSPPCQEQTDWLIFEDVQFIGDADLKQFVNCLDEETKVGNFRPLQDLNGRTILRYTKIKYEHKEATSVATGRCNTVFKLHHFVFLFILHILLSKF